MRLIDADELVKNLNMVYALGGFDVKEVHFSLMDMHYNIGGEPTVEAIPIEWIEKKIMMLKQTDDFIGDIEVSSHEMFEYVLEDWRKENERTTTDN